MAKNSKTTKKAWADLTIAEKKAIQTLSQNINSDKDNSPFPLLDMLFDKTAKDLSRAISERTDAAFMVQGELQAIIKALIDAIPKPTPAEIDSLDNLGLERYLLQVASLNFLIDVLNCLSDSTNTANAEMLN